MMMRRGVLVAVALLTATTVMADLTSQAWKQVIVEQGPAGTELTAYPVVGQAAALSPGAVAVGKSFQTFCLEAGEYLGREVGVVESGTWVDEATGEVIGSGSHTAPTQSAGPADLNGDGRVSVGDLGMMGTYWQTKGEPGMLGDINKDGSVDLVDLGFMGSTWGRTAMPFGDNLSPQTAYLFYQFATGKLDGYAYDGVVGGLDRSQTGQTLQRLIWALEGDGGADLSESFLGVPLSEAQQALARGWLDQSANKWQGVGPVRVLNTYGLKGDGGINYEDCQQDLLYVVPAPGAAVLAGLGLAVVAGWLRKRK